MKRAVSVDDYGIIGDGRSAALVGRDGCIDWLCWPRFDSPPIFGALLDSRAGFWSIAPVEPGRVSRRYVERTNVLETRFDTATGSVVLTDSMSIASEDVKHKELVPEHELLRRVECLSGFVELEVVVCVQPDFGRFRARTLDLGALGIRWEIGSQLLTLRSDRPLMLGDDGRVRARVRITAGKALHWSLSFDAEAPAVLPPLGAAASERIARSVEWWRQWVGRTRYNGPHRDAVLRSVLVLKLMSFAPSGAIIAAPTTSLPEVPGGEHNWDYRYCWLRDASFTARVFLQLGFIEDAQAFASWLLHATRLTQPALRVLYDVYGNQPPPEHIVPLEGFGGSQPVRVGNGADRQLQLDLHGEVIDACAQVIETTGHIDQETRELLRGFGEHVIENWREPDYGIWETRTAPVHHTHSRLLSWVALDRLDRLADAGHLQLDRARIADERTAIRRQIEDRAWHRGLQSYTAELDGDQLDAAVLLMSWYGFHPANSARMRSTYARLTAELSPMPGLLYRRESSNQIGEGAFWLCSYWAVEHLIRGGGSLEQALTLFGDATSYANDLGLMAEEVDVHTGRALGNFPQAYTHVGLISAALSIADRLPVARALPRRAEARP
ncbi:MAG TPA: glycoside hydrolase family 15 protein [Kofleriaceae bacterium]|nr:glycoside hydrolase family 15 protein [Kofleriaceae bacterium]